MNNLNRMSLILFNKKGINRNNNLEKRKNINYIKKYKNDDKYYKYGQKRKKEIKEIKEVKNIETKLNKEEKINKSKSKERNKRNYMWIKNINIIAKKVSIKIQLLKRNL